MKTPTRYRVFVPALAGLCVFVLAACSNTKKEGETYQNARALPSLEMPPDLISPPKDSTTAIPDLPPANKAPAVPTSSAAPPAASPAVAAVAAASAEPGIHIVKEGDRRWLVVTAPVEQVRQRVKDFLLKKGFTIAAEVPDAGMVETEWRGGGEELAGDDLNAALKSGLRDKFKLLVESGAATGTSEVRVSHLGLQRIMVDGKPQWQPRMSDPVLEAQILDELRAFLQNGAAAAAAPANDIPAVRSSVSTDAQGRSSLTLSENFDRAWQRVGDALPRGGFVIDDRNRSEGLYMIRLGKAFKEDAKAGFIARLFGSNAGNADEKYHIAVKQQGSETVVTVQQAGGGPVFTGIGERILDRLKEKMQ